MNSGDQLVTDAEPFDDLDMPEDPSLTSTVRQNS